MAASREPRLSEVQPSLEGLAPALGDAFAGRYRVIEELGHYNPQEKDSAKQFVAKLDRCQYWLDHGAIPSETVSSLLKKSGFEHKQLRLPKPGKPKAVPPPPAEKKAEGAEAKPEEKKEAAAT